MTAENNYYQKNVSSDPTLSDFPDELFEEKEFDEQNCLFGDGIIKHQVITINGHSPAKPIEVYENALVHVKAMVN